MSYGAIGNGMIWNTQLIHDPLEMCPIQLWKSIWLSQDDKTGQDECTHIVTTMKHIFNQINVWQHTQIIQNNPSFLFKTHHNKQSNLSDKTIVTHNVIQIIDLVGPLIHQ